jgi:secernin
MCDTMAAVGPATSDGAPLFGKNSDRQFTEAQYLDLRPALRYEAAARVRLTYVEVEQARLTHAVLLSKPHWIWGAEIGTNEHGLTIGNEALHSKVAASLAPGVIGMDYLRLALERAADVDEAIAVITSLLRKHGQSGNCGFEREIAYHNSFILADHRQAKVLETVDREWVEMPIRRYQAISNAMTIAEGFERSSPTLRARAIEAGIYAENEPFSFNAVFEDGGRSMSGRYRQARAMDLLRGRDDKLRPTDIFRVLRDHAEGPLIEQGRPRPRICAHTTETPLGQTTASWVSSLRRGKSVHWVTGTAATCSSLFKPVFMEGGLPEHGTRPGGASDATSLWWRHEQLRRRLQTADEQTNGAYAAERDELEARFVVEIERCPDVDHPEGIAQAKQITEACWRDALAFENRWLDRLIPDTRNAGIVTGR